jgi:hypothetical protein
VTEAQAIEGLYERWQSGWETLHPDIVGDPQRVPYTFKNENFATDDLGTLGAWARVSIIHSTADQVTMGSVGARKFERAGSIYVQIFAPLSQGVGLLARLADDARTVFEGVRVTDVTVHAGRTQEGPDDGAWAMTTVVFPFRYTDVR